MSAGNTSLTLTTTLSRAAVALVADTAISSGASAVCIQRGGRVGCVEQGQLRWLRLDAPVASMSSTGTGACALMVNGATTCWRDAGADSALRDVTHPPFVELRGTVARTAAGQAWVRRRRPWNGGWIPVASDSSFVGLLEQYNENTACARTAGGTIMCSSIRPSGLDPYLQVTAMAVVRDARDGSVVRGTGGYTAQPSIQGNPASVSDALVVRRLDGSVVMFQRASFEAAPWFERSEPDSSLSGPDATVRDCVHLLDALCDIAAPWRSVSQASALVDHPKGQYGYQRVCAVRGVVVCRTYDATGRLVMVLPGSRAGPVVSVDTIWLAP
ncbi:MAG TPA: hypothetical protein VE861_14440 [Gemmatimonadaceae bacterium]|nr:hypothetical protein [Gemmatimonadaceae bacterium]